MSILVFIFSIFVEAVFIRVKVLLYIVWTHTNVVRTLFLRLLVSFYRHLAGFLLVELQKIIYEFLKIHI